MTSINHSSSIIIESIRSKSRRLSPEAWMGILIVLALAARAAWLLYTRYTSDDAFITFRYAHQIALGNGFIYNLGEKLDGTTSPLYALLLAAWAKIIPDIVLGSKLLDLAFALAALLFVWQTLKFLGRSQSEQIGVILLLGLSSKLWSMETEGMEIPLVLFLMAASWYAVVRRRFTWAGLLLGLLIWTRVDLFLWPVLLAAVTLLSDVKATLRMAGAAILTYLPWVIFATLYFGSPIPYSITAKWVAYIQFDHSPLFNHFLTVLGYLSPFTILTPAWLNVLFIAITLAMAAYQAVRTMRDRRLVILICFVLLEMIRLTLTRATFESRYFVPALWATLILAGMAAGDLWGSIKAYKPAILWGCRIFLAAALLVGLSFALKWAGDVRLSQTSRDERSLMAIGLWLHDHAPAGSRVELEPLGYIGYYSDLTMLDDVGLVTPAVVDMKRSQVGGDLYFTYLSPDYLILHCDDALRMQGYLKGQDTGLAAGYFRVEQFNPLSFDPYHAIAPVGIPVALPRNSCYEIWQAR
ncbi:MAG: hypothetical protein ABSA51_02725 [Anaerolineaceae bacterium]|jgi:hypothetical protein